MKKQSIILRFLLLVLISQISLPLSFGQRLKNEFTHLRVIGEDKSLTNSCEDLFWAEDELLIEVSVTGLEEDESSCDDCPLPTACVPMHVAAYDYDTGDILGVSMQISSFTPSTEDTECSDHPVDQYPPGCQSIYKTQIAIPVNLTNYCLVAGSCQEINIHYELVTPDFDITGTKQWTPYTEVANTEDCSLILFPVNCFCHYEGDNPLGEQDKALQTIKYVCPPSGPEDPVFSYTREASTNVQSLATVASHDLETRPQDTRDQSLPKIYPNPARDFLLVDFPNSYDKIGVVQLLNGKGNIVLSRENIQAGQGKYLRLDIANLPAGLYLCRIYDGESITSQKIIITDK